MKTVYIASPYTIGDKLENVHTQILAAELLSEHGFVPFWPLHSHYWHELYKHDWQFWLDMDLVWLEKCDIMLRLPGESQGADIEEAHAKKHGIKVYYSLWDLLADYKVKSAPYIGEHYTNWSAINE